MDELDQNIIHLTDENGNEIPFEHLMTLEHNQNYYIVLQALHDMEDCMEGEAIILKIVQDEKGEDTYVTIEEEAEFQAVFEKCLAEMEDEDEDEDEVENEDDPLLEEDGK